ncbi:cytochrome P450, family 71, subfamily A, polypeptide 21 [Actinidia rufa]|uniref:Cytochrome P450, family 71, subfamily A, polypeptide 21 n=1 Tax=Actinidia rufa TaxID=165716 RepID=A0A7J0GMK9_9ERIC|nr:cytochrome P450, family 71, subfamily A, polypeptide 21 [Actinidia rufa]
MLFLLLSLLLSLLPLTLLLKRLSTTPPLAAVPSTAPIIGNLHQLGLLAHHSLHSLSLKHGPLMLLRFGSKPVLVVSSAAAAREIMKTQELVFSNRPRSTIVSKLLYGSRDVGFSPYGEYWRQIRSLCVVHLLSNKRVLSFRAVREEETTLMIDKIKQSYSSSPSLAVNLTELFKSLTNDVVCRVASGRKYGEEGRFKKLLGEFVDYLGYFDVGDYIPWLCEVREIAEAKRAITEDKLEKMPYLKAVIKETLRLHPPGPLLIPRESMRDTQVMGYDIAARTQVVTNAWTIGRDPTLWARPDEFWPERFMDSLVDFRGHDFEFIPFGAGRRGCPGIQFAMSVDELALANLVGHFDFSLPVGEELDMSEAPGLTVRKRTALLAVVTPW